MKRIHPKSNHLANLVAIVLLGALIGCRTPAGGIANPFLAPDRVPPPATRALMPGQAQPYYPGDPLPVMQSSSGPQEAASQNSDVVWRSASGAVGSRGDSRVPTSLALSNEPKVTVPSDESDLRFTTPASEALVQVASLDGSPTSSTPTAARSTNPDIVPVSYDAPVIREPSVSSPDLNQADITVVSPWRPPQISQPGISMVAIPVLPLTAVPAGNLHSMDVRLRAVPSPPTDTAQPTMPRIRLPNYFAPALQNGAALPAAPIYVTPLPAVPGGNVQAVQISPLAVAALPQAALSQDGFRPRGSMR
jgi:hypothetical protein